MMYIDLLAQCPAHTQGQIYLAIITTVEVVSAEWY